MKTIFYTFSYLNSLQNKIWLLLFSCQVMSNSLATPWTIVFYSIIIITTIIATFINTLMSQALRKNLYMYYFISSYFVPIRILRLPLLTKVPQLVGIWIHVFQTAELGCMVTTFIILNYSTLYHNNVLQIIYFPIVGH